MRNGILIVAALVALIAVAPPCAADDLYNLLAEVPFDANLIVACADAPAFRERLGEIGADELILSLLEAEEEDLAALYRALSGRFLLANGVFGNDILLIADMDEDILMNRWQDRPGRFLGKRLIYIDNGIFSLIGDDDEPLAYMAYDGNTARLSNNRNLVAPNPDEPHPKVTDDRDFAELLESFEIDRGLMVFAPEPDYAAVAVIPFQQNHGFMGERMADFQRAGMNFFHALFGTERWGASAARLELDDGPSIEIMRIMRDLPVPPAGDSTLTKPAWAEAPDYSIAGHIDLLKGIMPALRRGFAAVDQDILDEFNEDLAEVNAELSFDFERDFVGNLAGEWSVSVWDEGRWALRFAVNDPDAFLRQARIMAETGGEPWAPVDDAPEDARIIRTGAYLFPLLLRVEGNAVTMSGAAHIPESIRAEPARSAQGETQAFLASFHIFQNRWAEEIFDELEEAGMGEALAAIPLDTRLNLAISQGANYHRLTLRTENIGPDNLRAIFGIIGEMIG